MKLKIVSYNIHKGLNWTNQKVILDDLKEMITGFEADIVLLQEVVGQNDKNHRKYEEWPDQTQYEFLADQVWDHYSYAKNAVYDHGHHGNVILSKYPILDWFQRDISTNRLEQRGVLYSKVQIPKEVLGQDKDCEIDVYCLHLNLFHIGRKKQYQLISKEILKTMDNTRPIILAGDFNDWNHKSSSIFELEWGMKEAYKKKHGSYAKTFPAKFPFLSLDRIYVKNLRIEQAEIYRFNDAKFLSDHLPLMTEVSLELG